MSKTVVLKELRPKVINYKFIYPPFPFCRYTVQSTLWLRTIKRKALTLFYLSMENLSPSGTESPRDSSSTRCTRGRFPFYCTLLLRMTILYPMVMVYKQTITSLMVEKLLKEVKKVVRTAGNLEMTVLSNQRKRQLADARKKGWAMEKREQWSCVKHNQSVPE